MTSVAVQEYAAAIRPRYQAASKRAKGALLQAFCETTGMHRKAAIRLLNAQSRRVPQRRGRPPRYGPAVVAALVRVWEVSDRPCGKLLAPVLPDLVAALERHGELPLPAEVREPLVALSAATIDRLLQRVRTAGRRQPHHQSAATTALKSQIPIRTWSDWEGVAPGALQGDLVLHCGESTEGFYLTTLTGVDVATGWTVLESLWGMGKQRVGAGLHEARERLPFPLRSLHTDNGGEFINHTLQPWCRREGIAFSRGRGYRKNDQAYVEQKNWLAVRRRIGYDRYSSHAAQAIFRQLYPLLERQINCFRPIRKLVGKQRVGAKVCKQYDHARTPYQRLLASDVLAPEQRQALERQFLALNPARLQIQIDGLLEQLWRLAERPGERKQQAVG